MFQSSSPLRSYSTTIHNNSIITLKIRFLLVIPYLGYGSQLKDTLPGDGLELLVSATSLLEHVGIWLRNGKIQSSTLRIVQKHRDKFLKLYSLLSRVEDSTPSKEEAEASTISDVNGSQQQTGSIELFLDMRIEELEAFEKEKDAVSSFIDMCSVIKSGES